MKFVNGRWEYGKPSWEQTIRLIKIRNYEREREGKKTKEITEDYIKASQIAYQYYDWPEKLERYEGIDL
ncbi:hypothetical protein [Mailhella massiliensis]|uniref:hypothetical protein n=1 Tax=Mailhella massiliensis TaxID=1903261 RepID=UPI0023523EA6|nr:hypothetical protein [Mailhella massiliensis]